MRAGRIVRRTGLPRATAHRLAAGLEVHRLLARDGDGRWRLGPCHRAGARVNDPLLTASAAVLPRLREITGESVQLYRREGISRICIAAVEPPAGCAIPCRGNPLADDRRFGRESAAGLRRRRHPAGGAAAGEVQRRVLAEVRRRGWAQSAAEREPGVASVSAPVRDAQGTVIAAVSVSGPIDRIGRRPGAAGPPICWPLPMP